MTREATIAEDARPPSPAGGRRISCAGFTLVEVSLALLLIAVLAAVALPGLVRATGPSTLRIAAFQVSALLREDRNVALTTGRYTTTTIGAYGRRIDSGASSAAIDLPVGAVARIVDSGAPGIRFYADGRASGGAIVIASRDATAAVLVNADTGAIRVDAR